MIIRFSKKDGITVMFWLMTLACFFRFKEIAALHLYVFILAFFMYIFFMIRDIKKMRGLDNYIYLFLAVVLGGFFYVLSNNPSDNNLAYHILFFSLPVFYYLVAYEYISYVGKEYFIESIVKLCPVYTVYLIFEAIYRFLNAAEGEGINIYKLNSFATTDSNFLALILLMLWCLIRYIYVKTKDKRLKKYLIIFFIFSILTLSRSVMVTYLVLLYLEFCLKQRKKGNYFIDLANFIIIPGISFYLYHWFIGDSSFRSKLGILRGIAKIANADLLNQLYGYGYGLGETMYTYQYGDYGHLHIALLLGQVGIIGLLLFVFWFIRLFCISRRENWMIIFAFLISGLSLAYMDSSLFYCLAAICAIGKEFRSSEQTKMVIVPKK